MRNDPFDEIPRRIYDSVVHFVQFWPTTAVLSKSLGGGSYRVFGIDVLFGHRCVFLRFSERIIVTRNPRRVEGWLGAACVPLVPLERKKKCSE